MKDYVYSSANDRWEWVEIEDKKPKPKKKKPQPTQKGLSKNEMWAFFIVIGLLLIVLAANIVRNSWEDTGNDKGRSKITTTTRKLT